MWEALPPVTKAWLGCSVVSTALVSFGMLDPGKIAFYLPLIMEDYSLWRFFTGFLFFGKFSFNFLIQMFILVRFSSAMENDPFATSRDRGSADYLFSLLFMGGLFLIVAWYMNMYFLGNLLSFATLYLWSKKNPDAPTNIWGFAFKGAQLPWAMIAFNLLTGQSPVPDLTAVVVGHIFYFLVEVLPMQQQKSFLHTPEFLIRMMSSMTGRQYFSPAGVPEPPRAAWGHGQRLG